MSGADTTRTITATVNGTARTLAVEPRRNLADMLREELGLTGTHLGCEHGVCGACTILVDGMAVRGCLMLAVQADGLDIVTVEGLTPPEGLSDLQAAFCANHALQCGFCTPGFLAAATALLDEDPDPSAEVVRDALSGNVCRCTGYAPIVAAVLETARGRRGGA